MYQVIDNVLTVTVEDWCKAGLTRNMFENDSKRGYLSIYKRSINGNTRIDVHSIRRPERLAAIEPVPSKIPYREEAGKSGRKTVFEFKLDPDARPALLAYRKKDSTPLLLEQLEKCVNRASIFGSIQRGFEKHAAACARLGVRPKMRRFREVAAG
jgi:hypothetical protein